ncbi:hypothetical protein HMPREF0682_0891 [Propionibacterium acidifaciens F0233]|uniref:Uncharacterized protein n=1 Tax=Propionibacterium acidifaciens F0233 TaxID=553198 RepID=U2RGL8_9ACTN|nr:hypothetical protein HMPREF0682_0891 [Propionibacterium acidifaciens F0233]
MAGGACHRRHLALRHDSPRCLSRADGAAPGAPRHDSSQG